ncbi:MAG: UxaA family hydrolase [Daejeonella sp.]
MKTKEFLQLDARDNVLVALQDLREETLIRFKDVDLILKENIPAKHKLFINDMLAGEEIIMYGVLVGKLQNDVRSGERMTTTNTHHAAQAYAYRDHQYQWKSPDVSKFQNLTFNGYYRKDGSVGTANYWLFIPAVFCENRNLDVIKEALHHSLGYAVTDKYKSYAALLTTALKNGKDINEVSFEPSAEMIQDRPFQNIDGIKFLNHQGGCGGTRQDSELLSKLLAAYANHPNVAGITILSLGCQHIQVQDFLNELKTQYPLFDKPVLTFEQQNGLSEEHMITDIIQKTFSSLVEMNKTGRQAASLQHLTVGVKCGGSDGFSGISANPAVGYAADLLVGLGAKVLLAEFPELCGAEQNLIDRCVSKEIAEKFIELMQTYDAQAHTVGSGFHMNPSPGNIKDGLITDAIKSTGAAKKAGTSPVVDVLDYTEQATKPGLSLVCTPGNDVEATTGKAASGANLILFTTGLGTPTGNPVCPVIKIATNSALALRMSDIIDIDTGAIIRGEKTIEEMGEEILEYCIKAAGGEVIPKAVRLNQDDFIPWKRGVSL